MPELLPWLCLLLLLAFPPNRNRRVWWIGAPLAAVYGLTLLLPTWIGFMPGEFVDLYCQMLLALGIGLAATWLLLPWVGGRGRFSTLLRSLVITAAVGCLAILTWTSADIPVGRVWLVVLIALFALVSSVSMWLGGLLTRRQFSTGRLLAVTMLAPYAGWALITSIPVLFALLSGEGANDPWSAIGWGILLMGSSTLACLLPFVILGLANSFYRERLRLHLDAGAPPALPVPPPAIATGVS